MKDPKRLFDIDYTRILARKLQTVPAWRDMAKACNEVLGQEVDARRRRLEKIRDSVKYRRGDTLTNFDYRPATDKPAISELTREVVDIPVGTTITIGIVKNVIRNIAVYNSPDGTDYLDVSFVYNNEACRWLKPINITQERDALLKNSYIMGFDFFNTKLSDEDLQRLYEFVQLYWDESGSADNFIKFIGFIKNIRFDLVALWSEDTPEAPAEDPNTEYPYLEPWNDEMVSVKDGGNNWETSHVEIQYDLSQFNQFYTVNLDDLEQLFYYFAPIILVLERVTGHLVVETPTYGMGVVALTDIESSILQPDPKIVTEILALSSASTTIIAPSFINTKCDGCFGLESVVNLSQDCFDFYPYLTSAGII